MKPNDLPDRPTLLQSRIRFRNIILKQMDTMIEGIERLNKIADLDGTYDSALAYGTTLSLHFAMYHINKTFMQGLQTRRQ